MSSGSQQATKAAPKHTHNDRRQVSVKTSKSYAGLSSA